MGEAYMKQKLIDQESFLKLCKHYTDQESFLNLVNTIVITTFLDNLVVVKALLALDYTCPNCRKGWCK